MDLGITIKKLRVKRRISQAELAHKIGVTQGYLSLIERDEREPGLDLINKIAKRLNIPPQLIFLIVCGNNSGVARFKKPLKDITSAVDEILRTI